MAETTAVAEKKAFTTSLSEWSNAITGLIIDDYGRLCKRVCYGSNDKHF